MARLAVAAVFGIVVGVVAGAAAGIHAFDEGTAPAEAPPPPDDAADVTPAETPDPTPAVSAIEPGFSVWDVLAECESRGMWHIATGNGYFGGLQFDRQTWLAMGGAAYAPRADLATRGQQIAVAQRLHAVRGFQPWPACSRALGLR